MTTIEFNFANGFSKKDALEYAVGTAVTIPLIGDFVVDDGGVRFEVKERTFTFYGDGDVTIRLECNL